MPTDSAIHLVNASDTTPSSDIGTTAKENMSYTTLEPYTVPHRGRGGRPQRGRGGRPNRANARNRTYQTLNSASIFLKDAQAQYKKFYVIKTQNEDNYGKMLILLRQTRS